MFAVGRSVGSERLCLLSQLNTAFILNININYNNNISGENVIKTVSGWIVLSFSLTKLQCLFYSLKRESLRQNHLLNAAADHFSTLFCYNLLWSFDLSFLCFSYFGAFKDCLTKRN